MPIKFMMRDVLVENGISLEKFVEEVTVLSSPEVRLRNLEDGKIKQVAFETLDLACRVTGRPLCEILEYVPDDSPASVESALTERERLLVGNE